MQRNSGEPGLQLKATGTACSDAGQLSSSLSIRWHEAEQFSSNRCRFRVATRALNSLALREILAGRFVGPFRRYRELAKSSGAQYRAAQLLCRLRNSNAGFCW